MSAYHYPGYPFAPLPAVIVPPGFGGHHHRHSPRHHSPRHHHRHHHHRHHHHSPRHHHHSPRSGRGSWHGGKSYYDSPAQMLRSPRSSRSSKPSSSSSFFVSSTSSSFSTLNGKPVSASWTKEELTPHGGFVEHVNPLTGEEVAFEIPAHAIAGSVSRDESKQTLPMRKRKSRDWDF